jgi:hypothetical protein
MMAHYKVHAVRKTWFSLEVEATDPDDAISKAAEISPAEWQEDIDGEEWEIAPDGTEDAELMDAPDA